MADPTAADLATLMGIDGTDPDHLQASISTALGLVDGYCRGRARYRSGELRPGVREVVLTVAARLVANPGQVSWREEVGAVSQSRGVGFNGFTLPEQYVLNRYRKRAVGP